MSPDQLAFGQPPKKEAVFQRRSKAAHQKTLENQDAYQGYLLVPLIQNILIKDWEEYRKNRKKLKDQQRDSLRDIWGQEVEVPWYISPSIASHCLRWVGYEALSEKLGYKPATPTTEAIMAMMFGRSAHFALLRTIDKMTPGQQEAAFTIDEADLSGRIDYLFRNPGTNSHQVLELKFISDYAFSLIKRDRLPDYLRKSPRVYQPSPEHRRQVLQYMWAKQKHEFNISCANIIYVNKDKGTMKEGLVVWDALAKHDADEFISAIKVAKTKIDSNELPDPSVESVHVCARLCPYRTYCEYGQKFAAGQVKKEQKRRPRQTIALAKKEATERRAKAEKLGIVQSRLSIFEETEAIL